MPQICGERVQGHTGVRSPPACRPEPAFSRPGVPCGLSQGQIQTQGASGAACEPAFLISSQVMWAGAGAGTTLTTTSQEWYFSHLNVHGLPGDAVGSSPAAWVRACTSKQASRPHCSSVVPVLLRRRPDSIRPDSIRGSDIAAEAAFLQEGLSTSSCSQVLEQRPGCGVNSLADVQERKPRIRVKGPGQSPAHPVSRLRTSPGPREPALPAGRSVLPTSWPRLGSAGRSPSTSHLPTSKCRGRGSLFICLRPPFTQGCTEDEEGRV